MHARVVREQRSKRYSINSTTVRTWPIRQNAQPASSTDKLKHRQAQAHSCKTWYKLIIVDLQMLMYIGITGKGGAIR